jgi:hypothetical protein
MADKRGRRSDGQLSQTTKAIWARAKRARLAKEKAEGLGQPGDLDGPGPGGVSGGGGVPGDLPGTTSTEVIGFSGAPAGGPQPEADTYECAHCGGECTHGAERCQTCEKQLNWSEV